MGKSPIFSFPLSGRKNVAKQNDNSTGSTQKISKAQRVLGVESIDLNVSTSAKHISPKDCIHRVPISTPANSNLDTFSSRDEAYLESVSNISEKASSILGIYNDDMESRRSISHSLHSYRSTGGLSSSKSFTPRSDDYSRKASLSSQGASHSWTSNRESGAEHSQALRFSHLAHVATYIDATIDHIPELPGDDSFSEFSEIRTPQIASAPRTYINDRPGSSASCPVAIKPKSALLPGISTDSNFGNTMIPQTPICESKRPQLRYKNKSLPYPPTTASDTWSSGPKTFHREVQVNEIQADITSLKMEFEEDPESIPVSPRSSRHLTLTSQTDSEPRTPSVEAPFLKIPNFMDLKLSGPWSENGDDSISFRSSYCPKTKPSKSKNSSQPTIYIEPSASSITGQYFDIAEDALQPLTPVEMPISSSHCQYSTVYKDTQGFLLKAQDPSKSFSDEKSGADAQSESCDPYIPVTLNLKSNSHDSYYSNNSTSAHSGDDEVYTERIPLIIDTYANGWDHSSISSLCTDFNSASSATVLKNEPAYYQVPEVDVDNNRFSIIYPSTALMEVAQVAKVIRRTPVTEMIGRRNGKPVFTRLK